jgi:hypothetical protein
MICTIIFASTLFYVLTALLGTCVCSYHGSDDMRVRTQSASYHGMQLYANWYTNCNWNFSVLITFKSFIEYYVCLVLALVYLN